MKVSLESGATGSAWFRLEGLRGGELWRLRTGRERWDRLELGWAGRFGARRGAGDVRQLPERRIWGPRVSGESVCAPSECDLSIVSGNYRRQSARERGSVLPVVRLGCGRFAGVPRRRFCCSGGRSC